MLISFIVSSRGDWWSIRYVLASIQLSAEKAGAGYEVLLVTPRGDEATRARAAGYAEEMGVELRLVDDPGVSLPLSRDLGFRESRGDVIVFCDGDIGLSPFFAERALRLMEKYDLAAPSLRIVPLDKATETIALFDRVVEALTSRAWGRGGAASPPARVYRRRVLEEMGGYPVLTRYYAEDRVATAAAVALGYRYVYDPGLVMYKLDKPGFSSYREKYRRYGWGIVCDMGRAARRLLSTYLRYRRLSYINVAAPLLSILYMAYAAWITRSALSAARVASAKWFVDASMFLGELEGAATGCGGLGLG